MPQYIRVEWFVDRRDAERLVAFADRHELKTPADIITYLLELALGNEPAHEPVITVNTTVKT